MKPRINLEKLAQANRVLRTFDKQYTIIVKHNRMALQWMAYPSRRGRPSRKPEPIFKIPVSKAWMTRNGSFYPTWRLHTGGTHTCAIAQLIRYVQGKTIFPLSVWQHWFSYQGVPDDRYPNLIATLQEIGWPEEVKCVVCGEKPKGMDWWNGRELSGPCCSFGRCDKRFKEKEVEKV